MDHVEKIQAQWKKELPEVNLEAQGVIARLHRLANYLTGEITTVHAEYGLSEGEFDILCAIRREGEPFEIRPADIAKTTMVTTGGTSKRLDKLEKSGLIERVPHNTGDGRSKLVRLTAQGKATIEEAFLAHMENERRLVQSLGTEDQAVLERILKQWLTTFEGERG